MILIISSIVVIAIGVGVACLRSKRKFEDKVNTLMDSDDSIDVIDTSNLEDEFDRIDELQENIEEIRNNIEQLDIPTPEYVSSCDDSESSLNKLSKFFEEHSLATVGTEQFILSVIPTSQIGQSLHSMAEVLPPNLGHALFGDAISAIKDNASSVFTADGLERFCYGMQHLGHMQMASMAHAVSHHNFVSAALTPIKSGAMEALGANDATRELAHSITSMGSDMSTALESSQCIDDLTSATDFDITGHIPVVTIAISSFREFQLLTEDKTDYITSLKNIALDAAGAGVGALAGAKGGALAGSFFGPLGTGIGAGIGAIFGAVAGRFATNKIKQIPLKNAIEAYEKEYYIMKEETDKKSRETLSAIRNFADEKKEDFHSAEIIENVPVTDTSSVAEQIAISIYSFILNEVAELKLGVNNLKKSIWYSANKYDDIIKEYEDQIEDIESQLPDIDLVKEDPRLVIDTLVNIKMPNRRSNLKIQTKLEECSNELKAVNDKNNSSILVWSYMINNLYQKTLNDIADFSNEKMQSLNLLFTTWKQKMKDLQNTVEKERAKLG